MLGKGKPFSGVSSGLIFLPLTTTGQYLEGFGDLRLTALYYNLLEHYTQDQGTITEQSNIQYNSQLFSTLFN